MPNWSIHKRYHLKEATLGTRAFSYEIAMCAKALSNQGKTVDVRPNNKKGWIDVMVENAG